MCCIQARKALRALKGLVKIQALVRGYLVRKRVAATLQSVQAMIRSQAVARSVRARRSMDKENRFHPESPSRKYVVKNWSLFNLFSFNISHIFCSNFFSCSSNCLMKQEIINVAIEGQPYTLRSPGMDLMRAQKLLRLTLAWPIQDAGASTLQCLNVESIKQCHLLFHVQFKVESHFIKNSTLKSLNGFSILMKTTSSPQHTTHLVYQNV